MSQNEKHTGPDCWSCCSENKSEMVKLVDRCVFSCVSTFDVAAILTFLCKLVLHKVF